MSSLIDNPVPSVKQNPHLVEFRAGKMQMVGNTVHPDRREGLVFIYQSDNSLMHFCWKDRTNGNVEDDFIIFPDDIEFKHVRQCTTGRVYVLKFKSSSRKFFFWLQEPRTDKDEENCRKVNDFLNNPPTSASLRGSSGGFLSDLPDLGKRGLQDILGGMDQQQLMQLLSGMGMGGRSPGSPVLGSLHGRSDSVQTSVAELPSCPQSAVARDAPGKTTCSPPHPVEARSNSPTLRTADSGSRGNILSGPRSAFVSPAPTGCGPHTQLSDLQDCHSTWSGVDLASAVKPEALIPILMNPEVQRQLTEFLPEGTSLLKSEDELRNNINSPQFWQILTSFSAALQSGQLGLLMSQFGLGEDVANAAKSGDMEAFVRAMQEATQRKDEEEDDSMEH